MIDTACDWVRPILISKDDVLTDGTATQIYSHNTGWKVACDDRRIP